MNNLATVVRKVGFDRSSFNKEARTIELSISSETPYLREFGWEILGHDAEHINTERLCAPAPLLFQHDVNDVRGVLESYHLAEGKLRGTVRFARSEKGEELMNLVADGIMGQVSVGYTVEEFEEAGTWHGHPLVKVSRWTPNEVSIVTIAADVVGAGIGKNLNMKTAMTRAAQVYRNVDEQVELTEEEILALLDQARAKKAAKATEEIEVPATEVAEVVQATTDVPEDEKKEIDPEILPEVDKDELETERKKSLVALGRAMDAEDFAKICIKEGKTTQYFKSKVDAHKVTSSMALTQKQKGKETMFKFNDYIRAALSGRENAPEAIRAQDLQLRSDFATIAGKTSTRAMFMPASAMTRTYNVTTPTAGGNTTFAEFDAAGLIRHLHNSDVVSLLGVQQPTFYSEMEIPRQIVAPGSIAWGYGETTIANKVNNNSFGRLSLKPHRLSAYASLTTSVVNESRLDIASIIQDDLQAQINLAKQDVLLGVGGGDVPVGLEGSGVTAYTGATYATARESILRIATLISKKNANQPRSNFKILMNDATKTEFELIKRDAGSNVFLCENDKIENMQVIVSNSVADNVIYVGEWSQIMMPDFHGASVYADPDYKGGLRDLVFELWFDVGVKRVDHFVKATFA